MKSSDPVIKWGWLRALLFLVAFVIMQVAGGTLISIISGQRPGFSAEEGPGLLITSVVFLCTSLLVVFLFRRFIDRSTIASLGLDWKGKSGFAWTGFFSGVLVMCLGSLVLLLAGNLGFIGLDFSLGDFLLMIVSMALVAFYEELVVRGYLLNNLLQSWNKWISLLVSAAVFALFHLLNPNVTILSMLGVFFGGIVLGLNYTYTKNLWFGIFFHFIWNLLQGPVLGYDVSGIHTSSLLVQNMKGAEWLTGGSFGFEASALAILLLILLAVFLVSRFEKQFAPQTPVSK